MVKQIFTKLGKVLLGTFLSQSLVTSVFLLGWLNGWMRRSIMKRWLMASSKSIISSESECEKLLKKPYNYKTGLKSAKLREVFSGICSNFKEGLMSLLLTDSLTFFPALLLLFSWYIGWQVSFYKVYEQSSLGVSLAFLGMFLFSLTMFYIPLAQARYSLTQDWRSFYDFPFIKRVIWHSSGKCFLLVIAYLISSLYLTFVKILPTFLTAIYPNLENLTAQESLSYLNSYYFNTGILAFLLLVGLRSFGAAIYATSLLRLWQKNQLSQQQLHPQELHFLSQVNKEEVPSSLSLHESVRRLLFWLHAGYKSALLGLIFCLWLTFSFIPFVSEFFNYYPLRGFLNQPLVQLPYFSYVPPHTRKQIND